MLKCYPGPFFPFIISGQLKLTMVITLERQMFSILFLRVFATMPAAPFHVLAPSSQAELTSAALLYVPASFPFGEPLPYCSSLWFKGA